MRAPLVVLAGLLLLAVPVAAQDGATLRVAADGSAEYETIGAALGAASAGDTVLIAPGTYVENLVIDRPVTLRGDGPREEIVIAPDPRSIEHRVIPDGDPQPTHVFIDGVDATIESVSLADHDEVEVGVMLSGGNPVLRDIVSPRITGVNGDVEATVEGSELGRIILMGPDAGLAVRGNTLTDGVVVGMGASALVEDNLFLDVLIEILEGSSLDIRGNTFRLEGEPGVWVAWADASVAIVDNHIEGANVGIMVEHGSPVHVEGNTVIEPEIGIVVFETDAYIRDNTVTDAADLGIVVAGNGITAEGNMVRGGRVGILANIPNSYPPGAPRLDEPSRVVDNTITGASHFGLAVDGAAPVVSGNTICAAREPLRLERKARPQLGANEICEVDG